MKRWSQSSSPVLALVIAGCGADEQSHGSGFTDAGSSVETSSSVEASSSAEQSSSVEASSSADTGSSIETGGETARGSSDDEAGPEPDAPDSSGPGLAGGIDITGVDANQGVAVLLARGSQVIEGAARNAYLIANRKLLVRALYDVADDWTPRELNAKLLLSWADGSSQVVAKKFMVEADSVDGGLDGTLWWYLPADYVKPGLEYAIEVHETTSGFEHVAQGVAKMPVEGSATMGIEDSHMVLEVVLVPVHHDTGAGNCPAAPTLDLNTLDVFARDLAEQNPVERVELTVRSGYTYTESLSSSFDGLLNALRDLRNADAAAPDVYYYGIVSPCDGGPPGFVNGTAIDVPNAPSRDNWYTRIAVGRWLENMVEFTSSVLVHEIGHLQGRQHILCNGEESAVDPTYPYDGGSIGVLGFGIEQWDMYHPSAAKDYMSYCGNLWVSDWGWNKVYPFIKEITSWDLSGKPPEWGGAVLVGTVSPDGTETWTTLPGSVSEPALSEGHKLEFRAGSKILTTLSAVVRKRPHVETLNVYVPLPATFASTTSIVHVAHGARIETPRKAIVVRHGLGLGG